MRREEWCLDVGEGRYPARCVRVTSLMRAVLRFVATPLGFLLLRLNGGRSLAVHWLAVVGG